MKTIAFYISDHGFGHIMRNISVISWVLEQTEHRIFLVSGEKQVAAACSYLQQQVHSSVLEERLITVAQNTDVGFVVKPGSLLVDWGATEAAVRNYVSQFPAYIAEAKEQFVKYQVDCVVCDIVSWALLAAKEAGIPSYIMASFTWIEQYDGNLPEELVSVFRHAYESATQAILYGLHTPLMESLFPRRHEVSLCARPFLMEQVAAIRQQFPGNPIVFVSIGMSNAGIRNGMDVSGLPYWFIITEGVNLVGNNVHVIPKDVDNTQDYIMASDYCLAKAGWTTLAEILIAGKPMALLSRPDVTEDSMYIKKLQEEGLAIEMSVSDLEQLDVVLERMDTFPFKKSRYRNDVEIIGGMIEKPPKFEYNL